MFKRAFTLIEIIFVLAIMAVLFSFILPSFKGLRDEADLVKSKSEMALLKVVLDTYSISHEGVFPPNEDYQQTLINDPTTAQLINKRYLDPFKLKGLSFRDYDYLTNLNGNYFVLRSYGLNKEADFNLQDEDIVDFTSGRFNTVNIPEGSDDLYETNLTIVE